MAVNVSSITWSAPTGATEPGGAGQPYYLDAGDVVQITYKFSNTISISAGSYIALSNGAHAVYSSGSGTSTVVFTYTVGSGDTNSSSLKQTDVTLYQSDGSAYGNGTVHYGGISSSSPSTTDVVDTLAPTITVPVGAQSDSWTNGNPEGPGNIIFGTDHGNAITIADAGGGDLTVTVSVGTGNTFTLTGDTTGIDFVSGSNGSSTMTFSGSATAINAALQDAVYHSTSTNTHSGNIDDTISILAIDAAGNTQSSSIGIDVICFMAGTMIRTPNGEIAVETLKSGDLVTTVDGLTKPVVWLGRQTVSTVFADKLRVLPIRIKAGALGNNVPSRDLLISPDHALLIGGALIQAGALVNGTSIVRERNVPAVFTYYHVEVDDHSLILAENTPAETFVDNVDRLGFDNWAEHELLYPNGKHVEELPQPRSKSHRQVPVSVRAMLGARAKAIGAAEGSAVA